MHVLFFLHRIMVRRNRNVFVKGLKGLCSHQLALVSSFSFFVYIFAADLIALFIDANQTSVIMEGVRYLHIEGSFYFMIGILFLFYGLYRALGKPGMSVVLTVISLGLRVLLAYTLSGIEGIGVVGIWWSVPIGWFLADLVGFIYYFTHRREILS